MVNRSCHIPVVYSTDPRTEKPGEPWRQDCGSGRAPQFGGDTQGFTDPVIPGPISYLAGFQRTRPVARAVGTALLHHTTMGAPPPAKVRGFRAYSMPQRSFL